MCPLGTQASRLQYPESFLGKDAQAMGGRDARAPSDFSNTLSSERSEELPRPLSPDPSNTQGVKVKDVILSAAKNLNATPSQTLRYCSE